MAQTVQRRRHQEPAQLSRLAPRPRSLGRPSHSTKLDQKRHRKRAIPTTNAVRALLFDFCSLLCSLLFRSGGIKDSFEALGKKDNFVSGPSRVSFTLPVLCLFQGSKSGRWLPSTIRRSHS